MSKATNHKELILSIKQEIKSQNLTQQEVYDLLTEKGFYISKDTLGHLLRKGSEEKKYKFDGCLQALAAVFFVEKTPVPVEELDSVDDAQQYIDQIEALQAVAQAKQTVIEDLQADLQSELPSPAEILPKIEELQIANEEKQTILVEQEKSIAELTLTIENQQEKILRLEGENRRLKEYYLKREDQYRQDLAEAKNREDRRLDALREDFARSSEYLRGEIEYLRRENDRKSLIIEKLLVNS